MNFRFRFRITNGTTTTVVDSEKKVELTLSQIVVGSAVLLAAGFLLGRR